MSNGVDIDMELLDQSPNESIEKDESISKHLNTQDESIQTVSENIETTKELPAEFTAESSGENNTDNKSKQNSRIPLARVKQIMKFDPECSLISKECLLLVAKATELFIEYLGKESVKHTIGNKKKTVSKKDVEAAIDCDSNLCFLDGALDWE